MGKIRPLKAWGAKACLGACLETFSNEEKTLVLSYDANGAAVIHSANLTNSEALYLIEQVKFKMLSGTLNE
jgi:hypothetical protein